MPGRPDQQDALGDPAAERLVLLGRPEELDDLAQLGDDLVVAGDVVERDAALVRRVDLGPALARTPWPSPCRRSARATQERPTSMTEEQRPRARRPSGAPTARPRPRSSPPGTCASSSADQILVVLHADARDAVTGPAGRAASATSQPPSIDVGPTLADGDLAPLEQLAKLAVGQRPGRAAWRRSPGRPRRADAAAAAAISERQGNVASARRRGDLRVHAGIIREGACHQPEDEGATTPFGSMNRGGYQWTGRSSNVRFRRAIRRSISRAAMGFAARAVGELVMPRPAGARPSGQVGQRAAWGSIRRALDRSIRSSERLTSNLRLPGQLQRDAGS